MSLGDSWRPSRILIHRDVEQTRVARRVARLARERHVPLTVTDEDPAELARTAPDLGASTSKETLLLTAHRGAVLKPCTGRTDSLLCCNLRVLTQTVGCPLDCSYCVLHSYQNRGVISVGANLGTVLERLEQEARCRPGRLMRVCTGQVGDSLALEPWLGVAGRAVGVAARLPNILLELKTKTDQVEPLLSLPHGGRTVISWSLSPEETAQREEHHCATTAQRLAAAARVAEAGYLVAFHLDPMIPGLDAQTDQALHADLLAQALEAVPAQRVAYISMGTVRFPPAARRTLLGRFPDSRATLGELHKEVDGKLRPLTPRRVALYQAVASVARQRCPQAFLYLCMEPERVWVRALGTGYADREDVELALARSLHQRFGLAPMEPRPENYGPDPEDIPG